MIKVDIKGKTYRIGKLNALAQFHVTRRVGPVLVAVGIPLAALREGMKIEGDDFLPLLEPVMDFMAKMKEDDANYVIFTCLSVVSREEDGDRVAPVAPKGMLMFDDIQMPDMLRLVIEVLKENLGNFLQELSAATSSQSS